MSDTRSRAKQYLINKYGSLPSGIICTSKLYISENSWTGRPAYWIEIPMKKLNNPKFKDIHILCNKKADEYYYLLVPKCFILDNIDKLAIIKGEKVSIWPSARPDDMFIDLRGQGKLNFGRWLQE